MHPMRSFFAPIGGALLAIGVAGLASIGLVLVPLGVVALALSVRTFVQAGEALAAAGVAWLVIALANADSSCLPGGHCADADPTAWVALGAAALAAGVIAIVVALGRGRSH